MTTVQLQPASFPVVRAMLDRAMAGGRRGGVIGLRTIPVWAAQDSFTHQGVPVTVAPCRSALAVREALAHRGTGRWLVILTDRDDDDLNTGITAHLVGGRLRIPDPWESVQEQFGADRIERRLTDEGRAFPDGLLAARPEEGWLPARGGLLTWDHACGSVARARLQAGSADDLDTIGVLLWTTLPGSTTALADLRSLAGDIIVDEVLDWMASRAGSTGDAIRELLRSGRLADVVPFGLVARVVLETARDSAPRALLRRDLGVPVSDDVLRAWAGDSEAVARRLLENDSERAGYVLSRADALVGQLEATGVVHTSDLLRTSLTSRLAALGTALARAVQRAPDHTAGDIGTALVDPDDLAEVETAHRLVRRHRLAVYAREQRVPKADAAVRLVRWLARPVPEGRTLAELMVRHRDHDAWVDRAVADVWTGVNDETLARGLRAVLAAVRLRRDAHDLAFAAAVAREGTGHKAPEGVTYLEHLIAKAVVPLAAKTPTLLVVVDGASAAVVSEILEDLGTDLDGWQECLPGKRDRRATALAVLPSLTRSSRTSLLSGELSTGQQREEQAGFAALCAAHHLEGRLFHKGPMEAAQGGFALPHDVAAAIDDTSNVAVVACVLNTVDDALDRSDPGGTTWVTDSVKHLVPLLKRARDAGRIVVITADHGHVVERREGEVRSSGQASSNRSRSYVPGGAIGPGEVRVQGPRVLEHGGDAILAVDERLRYGPVKAGYHGGASPAELVVPFAILTADDPPPGWRFAQPQSPDWWRGWAGADLLAPTTLPKAPKRKAAARQDVAQAALFEASAAEPGYIDLVAAVQASKTYSDQRGRAARTAVDDDAIRKLLLALLTAPDNRLDPESAASALGLATVQLAGAVPQVQRLLNVEQYPVLTRDADGRTLVLDAGLLQEQFEVAG